VAASEPLRTREQAPALRDLLEVVGRRNRCAGLRVLLAAQEEAFSNLLNWDEVKDLAPEWIATA